MRLRLALGLVGLLSTIHSTTATSAPITVTCGALVSSVIKTNAGTTTISTTDPQTFRAIPGANVAVKIPAGSTRCVRVTFTAAESDSGGCDEKPSCYTRIRALANSIALNPSSAGDPPQFTNHHQWVRRLGAGTHSIQIQVMPVVFGEAFVKSHWVLEVQVLN